MVRVVALVRFALLWALWNADRAAHTVWADRTCLLVWCPCGVARPWRNQCAVVIPPCAFPVRMCGGVCANCTSLPAGLPLPQTSLSLRGLTVGSRVIVNDKNVGYIRYLGCPEVCAVRAHDTCWPSCEPPCTLQAVGRGGAVPKRARAPIPLQPPWCRHLAW
jgi:hypothetical protein